MRYRGYDYVVRHAGMPAPDEFKKVKQVYQSDGMQAGWQAGWPDGRKAGQPAGRQAGRQAGR